MSDAAVNPMKAGLEDVVVSPSEICFIDGHKGRLVYRGFDVDELVAQSNFEEVTYLLWYGKLPTRKELDTHVKALSSTANRKLPPKLIAMLKLLPKKTTPMEVLRTGISALSAFDPDAADNSREATLRKTIRLTAQMPTLVAAWDRIRRGKPPVGPNPRLSLAGNFLYMMSGKKPTPLATKTFDVALILHADHEFNASTFAARVTAATLSDIHSAVVSGIGALKGPLHGGATGCTGWKTHGPSTSSVSLSSWGSRQGAPPTWRSSTPWRGWSPRRKRSSPTWISTRGRPTRRWGLPLTSSHPSSP